MLSMLFRRHKIMCGRKAGSKTIIHAMKKLFEMDAVILADSANASNSVNGHICEIIEWEQPTGGGWKCQKLIAGTSEFFYF